MHVMGVGTAAGPIEDSVLQTSFGVIVATAIVTATLIGSSADAGIVTAISTVIGSGVAADRHS